jgi:hypothetical protein
MSDEIVARAEDILARSIRLRRRACLAAEASDTGLPWFFIMIDGPSSARLSTHSSKEAARAALWEMLEGDYPDHWVDMPEYFDRQALISWQMRHGIILSYLIFQKENF